MKRKPHLGDPKRAVGYIRVSKEEQKLGPEAQLAALNEWCKREGVELVSIRKDLGVSGGADIEKRLDDGRSLALALTDLETLNAGVLLVTKRDRLARDVMVAASIERMVQKAGAKISSADGIGAGDGPEAALLRTLIDAFAAYERALIRHRTQVALAVKRDRQERIGGQQPYGQRVAQDGRHVEPVPEELEVRAYIRKLRGSGLTLRAIVAKLNGEGVLCRGKRWHLTTVHRLLQREQVAA